MNQTDLRKITIEEYIEANGGMLAFLEGLHDFAKENGFHWQRQLSDMMSDVEYRARLLARLCVWV